MSDNRIQLTETSEADLPLFFRFQLDEDANRMAAFTAKDQPDEASYIKKFTAFLNNPTITMRTIKMGDRIIGSIAKFVMHGDAEVTYWIDKAYWHQGVATQALQQLLTIESVRPIFGRTAFDNIGSQRVLEKAGFVKIGADSGFANARQCEIEEYIYKLI